MKKNKTITKLICLALSLLLGFPYLIVSANSPQNANVVSDIEYFDDFYYYVGLDYASYYVSQFGGWDEGIDLNPTDFVAQTHGVGFCYHNWYKIIELEAFFYEPDLLTYQSTYVSDIIDFSENTYSPNTGDVYVYGEEYVNEEYGLTDFTTDHFVRFYIYDAVSNTYTYYNNVTEHIYFDTTGFYR